MRSLLAKTRQRGAAGWGQGAPASRACFSRKNAGWGHQEEHDDAEEEAKAHAAEEVTRGALQVRRRHGRSGLPTASRSLPQCRRRAQESLVRCLGASNQRTRADGRQLPARVCAPHQGPLPCALRKRAGEAGRGAPLRLRLGYASAIRVRHALLVTEQHTTVDKDREERGEDVRCGVRLHAPRGWAAEQRPGDGGKATVRGGWDRTRRTLLSLPAPRRATAARSALACARVCLGTLPRAPAERSARPGRRRPSRPHRPRYRRHRWHRGAAPRLRGPLAVQWGGCAV